jgi:LPXTG-motif cell wall-anchored protein
MAKYLNKNNNSYILIGFVILIGIIVIYFYFKNKESSPTQSPPADSPSITLSPTKPSTTLSPSASALLSKAVSTLVEETKNVQDAPTSITSTYGKIDKFYIAGKASILDSSLNQIKTIEEITSIPDIINPNNMPPETTVFIYNPIQSSVTYYTGNLSLSKAISGNLTIGSVLP